MQHLHTWQEVTVDSDFSIYNLPFGIYSIDSTTKKIASRIGDLVIDMEAVQAKGILDDFNIDNAIWASGSLNAFIELGKATTNGVRKALQQSLCDSDSPLRTSEGVFHDVSKVDMHMPVEVGDYTDFYSSIEHATNLGKLFRDPENALLPNWRHIPVGYHGRASSIIVSGTPIKRPHGQTMPPNQDSPVFGPSKRLDIELETAFVIGKNSTLGTPLSTDIAEDYIFGMCLFNDWSARDIQKWEYVPLGPFLGKNFASSISPWIVTLEALDYFRVPGPEQKPKVLDYLQYTGTRNIDIKLGVDFIPHETKQASRVSNSNFKFMYWNMAQQLTHHTINGCNVRVGDMMASGTISGQDKYSFGSLLEMTWGGKEPFTLDCGTKRTFLEDGDTIVLTGYCEKDGIRVGFGEVRTEVLKG